MAPATPPAASPSDEPHWSVDRKIPLPLIIAMFAGFIGQALYVSWYGAKLDSRVETIERRMDKEEGVNTRQGEAAFDVSTRIVRLEERTLSMLDLLKNIDRKVSGIPPSQQPASLPLSIPNRP